MMMVRILKGCHRLLAPLIRGANLLGGDRWSVTTGYYRSRLRREDPVPLTRPVPPAPASCSCLLAAYCLIIPCPLAGIGLPYFILRSFADPSPRTVTM